MIEVVVVLAGCVLGSYWGTKAFLNEHFPRKAPPALTCPKTSTNEVAI